MPDAEAAILVHRPEITGKPSDPSAFGVVEAPLSTFERLYNWPILRKTVILLVLAVAWEIGARLLNNALLLPTFSDTLHALFAGIATGEIPRKLTTSLEVLMMGYAAGIVFAALLTAFGIFTQVGNDLLETLTAMFNPLPAIALLPIALIWFGLGYGSLVFVLVHSVVWAVALNTHAGFMAVSPTMRMVGRNYGLTGLSYVSKLLIPAALPSILTGLKIGWAFAWRTLIASELVFGVSSGAGGLGWYIYENKNALEIANVFAGLLTVILIGLVVENLIFRVIERRTVRRWGMQN